MKRITALFAVIVLAAAMFAGCDDSTIYRHYDASAYEKQFAAPKKGDTMAELTTSMGTAFPGGSAKSGGELCQARTGRLL